MTALGRRALVGAGAFLLLTTVSPAQPHAADAVVIDAQVEAALLELQQAMPGSSGLLDLAEGVLVMPSITKGGFIVGAEYGEGALLIDQTTAAYYSVAGGSVGLQAGIESFAQALFFMTPEALAGFQEADGWEAGADAEVTLLSAGFDASTDTTVTNQPVIGIVFGANGLLAGASIQGSKYTRIER